MQYEGRVEVIFGPMFSGKSSELQRRIKRHQIAKKKCIVLNYKEDNRYTDEEACSTHDKCHMKARKISLLKNADSEVKSYDVIAVDEGQFFADLIEFSDQWANQGKIVIIAA